MNFKHLISEKGILVNFSVAKRISSEKIKSLETKIKKNMKVGDNLEYLLKQEISKQTQKTLNINDVPGLLINKNNKKIIYDSKGIFQNESKVMMLNLFGIGIAKKLINQKFKKDEICFVILTILGSLGLTDEDFRMFHKNNYSSTQDHNDEYEDEEDEDDEDDDEF